MLQELFDELRRAQKANLAVVAVNIIVFVLCSLSGNTEDAVYLFSRGACYTPAVLDGEYWRLFTAMFLHFGAVHLVFNMICLFFMGDMLERIAGPVRYLLIYLLGGLAGNALSLAWELYTGDYVVSAGASGAIFSVIGAVFVHMLRNRKSVGRESIRRISLMVALMVIEGFTQAGTDNAAHIGGLLAGMLLSIIFLSNSSGA